MKELHMVTPSILSLQDGALGVIMILDHAGRESDESTTPAFREWVAGETYEDELEFAHCPNTRIQGFRVVFYPYQVGSRYLFLFFYSLDIFLPSRSLPWTPYPPARLPPSLPRPGAWLRSAGGGRSVLPLILTRGGS